MMKIYVGNLSFEATEEQLRDLFGAHGDVQSVAIIRDRDTGRSRGFGFIEMSDDSEGRTAIEKVSGTDLGGRTLNVNEARPKSDRRGGGGGGGGGRW